MSDSINHKIHYWGIQCVDRSTGQKFNRETYFAPPKTADLNRVNAALRVLNHSGPSHHIIEYRDLFVDCEMPAAESLAASGGGFHSFCVPDYFEDENGKRLSISEYIEVTNGMTPENALVMSNVESVLRLPRDLPINGKMISQEESNDYAHFFQVVSLLGKTTWAKHETNMSWTEGGPVTVSTPDWESTLAALALIRQFFLKRDDVFEIACSHYLSSITCQFKKTWVQYELDLHRQNSRSDWRPVCPEFSGISRRELIERFVYGTGLFHRSSNDDEESKLMDLYQRSDKKKLLFAFHTDCQSLLGSPSKVYPLIYREMAHWINEGVCPNPTRVVVQALFEHGQSDNVKD